MRKLTVDVDKEELFGKLDALDEKRSFFRNCFYATKAFKKLKAKKRFMIVVGEKGTGKSALLRMAAIEDDESDDTIAVDAKYLEIDKERDISQKVQAWKEYLGGRIIEKIQQKSTKLNANGLVQQGLSIIEDTIGSIVKTKYGLDYAQIKVRVLSLLMKKCKIRLYIDELDFGYQPTHEKNQTIIALFTAVREMMRDLDNLSCRIALRTDVFDNVRREDESSDKIKDAKMKLLVTNHEIMTMLTKRVMCYLEPDNLEKDYSSWHQSRMMKEMYEVFDPIFYGHGRWKEQHMYNVIMSFVRRRPRDIISLCGMAWEHATSRGQTRISTEDIESVIDEYSKDCRSDIIAEYRQEFSDEDTLNHLLGGLRPSRNETKRKEKLFVYTRDDLIKKIDTITEHEKIHFSNGNIANSDKLAEFLYRANVVIARKDLSDGSIQRIYYMEQPDLIAGGIDQGYQFEVHPAYRGAISLNVNILNTVDIEAETFN